MKIKLGKIGGASLNEADAIKTSVLCYSKLDKGEDAVLNVVSAWYDITNKFERFILYAHSNMREDAEKELKNIYKFHHDILKDLFPTDHEILKIVENLIFIELDNVLGRPYDDLYIENIWKGEIISANIMHQYCLLKGLKSKYIDSTKYIVADNKIHGNILFEKTNNKLIESLNLIEKEYIHWAPGFVGIFDGSIAPLEREKSDDSAVAYALGLRQKHLLLENCINFYKKRPVFGSPCSITYKDYLMIEEKGHQGVLLSPDCLKTLMDNKMSFRIIYFDVPQLSTLVHP